jgi:hypothetical protein
VAGPSGPTGATGPVFSVLKDAFRAKMTTDQSITVTTNVKMLFGTKVFDVNIKYDSTNSRWTPAAGIALIGAGIYFSGGLANNSFPTVMIYKNGALLAQNSALSAATASPEITVIDQCNGADYYEVYVNVTPAHGSASVQAINAATSFYGSLL